MKRVFVVVAMLVPAAALWAQQPPVAATPPRTAVSTGEDRMICKKFPVTGSLVQMTRVCKEKRYWDMEDALRRQNTATSSCGSETGICSGNDGFAQMGGGH